MDVGEGCDWARTGGFLGLVRGLLVSSLWDCVWNLPAVRPADSHSDSEQKQKREREQEREQEPDPEAVALAVPDWVPAPEQEWASAE